MGKSWGWDPAAARKANGCGDPVDRIVLRSGKEGAAILPADHRTPMEDSARLSPSDMWAGYFVGSRDPEKCRRLDEAVRAGKCVALGCVAGVYSEGQIFSQVFGDKSGLGRTYTRRNES